MNYQENGQVVTKLTPKEKITTIRKAILGIAGDKRVLLFIAIQLLLFLVSSISGIYEIVNYVVNATGFDGLKSVVLFIVLQIVSVIVPLGYLFIGLGGYHKSESLLIKGLTAVYTIFMISSALSLLALVFIVINLFISVLMGFSAIVLTMIYIGIIGLFYSYVHRVYLFFGGMRDYYVIPSYAHCRKPKPKELIPFMFVYLGLYVLILVLGLMNVFGLSVPNTITTLSISDWLLIMVRFVSAMYVIYLLRYLACEFKSLPFNEELIDDDYDYK